MNEPMSSRTKGITGNTLKMIAIISMLIDHTGVAIIENGILKYQNNSLAFAILSTPEGKMWSMADLVLRTMGRLAFPIFCFLLVEGFCHTKDVKKYGARLLVFALISEIPFDLALFDKWFNPGYQNVYFTLFLGLWVLYWYRKTMGQPVKQSLVILAGCGASILLKCDYNIIGIVMILLFYVFYENKRLQTLFGGVMAAVESLECFGAAMLALIPIRMYNGTRGKKNLKYFFYWFYPVHLLLLYILRLIII
ncbi:TraX family protein [Clostridium sp. Marseille-P2415]|uniref:TraX family protein n=1 Tax=Clostridium sp. Marseille-P2415 TaxID=1805471 RepID=UPI0009885F70|nr:TraX family protein [Clostridium sp. Marseille-P2415]